MNLKDAEAARDALLAEYRSKAPDLTAAQVADYNVKIKAAHQAVSDVIAAGAMPCPFCEQPPHGMKHPRERGGFEFEVGCIACPPFTHEDGTRRGVAARGGLLPRHAVEAWNEGPGVWKVLKDEPAVTTPSAQGSAS